MDLLVDSNALWFATASLEVLSGLKELAVLSRSSERISERLIEDLRIWRVRSTGLVMPLLNERRAALFKSVAIGRVAANLVFLRWVRRLVTSPELSSQGLDATG